MWTRDIYVGIFYQIPNLDIWKYYPRYYSNNIQKCLYVVEEFQKDVNKLGLECYIMPGQNDFSCLVTSKELCGLEILPKKCSESELVEMFLKYLPDKKIDFSVFDEFEKKIGLDKKFTIEHQRQQKFLFGLDSLVGSIT